MKTRDVVKILHGNDLFVTSNIKDMELEIGGRPQTDNRAIVPGDIFICIKGHRFDGHNYIPSAHKSGASLIVQQTPISDDFPTVQVTNTRKAAALLVASHHGNPASKLKVIGVTGTNGKTTTTMLIYQSLMKFGKKCGWIGTLGYYVNEVHKPTEHTTPDIVELQAMLKEMVDAGCEYVVMEISSHALALDRVYGVPFLVSMFTNLSRDHLDFHYTMSEYAHCKYLLFEYTRRNRGTVIINIDDKYGSEFYQKLKHDIATMDSVIVGVGRKDMVSESDDRHCLLRSLSFVQGDYLVTESQFDLDCSSFILQTNALQYKIKSHLIGHFNILNLALTVALLDRLQIPQKIVESIIPDLDTVPGRLQKVPNNQGLGVYIDYAHTPDALSNVLQSLAKLTTGRLLCLFGAGGDRDHGKRSEMLTTAMRYADTVIITDDNPRYENPDQIIRDIIGSTNIWSAWWIIRDRHTAIESIINLANEGDIVLIAGKGHEKYREIAGTKLYFDDYLVAEEVLGKKRTDSDKLALPVDRLMLDILFNHQAHTPNTLSSIKPQHFFRISTDSRSIKESSIFFAIKGENYDGHNYVGHALAHKDNIAIVQHDDRGEYNRIVTADTVVAMGKLCRKYLQMFPAYRIALTGSTGKTGTKEILSNILESVAPTLKTEKNENNIIGLCKTIQRIKPNQRYAIFEIGTNHFGEIAQLADVIDPQCGIILNVGPSHLEAFGDEDGVFWEKTALFRRDLDKMIYSGDDERFAVFSDHGVPVGSKSHNKYQIDNIHTSVNGVEFTINSCVYQIPQTIPFYATNASFAIATAIELGVDPQIIRIAIQNHINLDHRMELIETGGGVLIVDCYNANPVSMQKAIEFFFAFKPENPHIAILGDMLELGDSAVLYHKMIGAMLCEYGNHTLISVGQLSNNYHSTRFADYRLHFDTVGALIDSVILKDIPSNAIVLLKASHSIHLEKVVPHIQRRH